MEVGIDIVEIERIKKINNLEFFLQKNYDQSEIKYVLQKPDKFQSIAGLFCAKEAVLKAFGIGIINGVSLKNIVINHENNGKPFVLENNTLKELLNTANCKKIKISISHSTNIATAICIIN